MQMRSTTFELLVANLIQQREQGQITINRKDHGSDKAKHTNTFTNIHIKKNKALKKTSGIIIPKNTTIFTKITREMLIKMKSTKERTIKQ